MLKKLGSNSDKLDEKLIVGKRDLIKGGLGYVGDKTIQPTVFVKANEVVEQPEYSKKDEIIHPEGCRKHSHRIACHYCGVLGHNRPRCFKLLKDLRKKSLNIALVETWGESVGGQKQKFVCRWKDQKWFIVATNWSNPWLAIEWASLIWSYGIWG